ncbi:MAG: hypothetical protein OXU23_23335, partial [Candidatus Poribacteria bacterium]|nr:hypothetical protein [Candidatus Poribacteria bacterium]
RPPQQELLPQTFAQLPEKPKLIAKYHNGPRIESVAFSPADPFLIAFADEYGTVRLWNRNNTKEPIRILSHPELSASVGFSPTGELLVSSGYGKLVLWDVVSGMKLNTLKTSREFAFTPDGHRLATVYNEVKLWDIRNPKKIKEITTLPFDEAHTAEGWASAVGISPNGKWIAAGYSLGTIKVWDLKTRQHVKTLETFFHEMNYLKFSPDNKFLAAGGDVLYKDKNNKYWISRGSGGYNIWELPSWKRHGEVLRGNIDNLVFSPDGKVCVSANDESFSGRGVELWSVESGAPITFLPTQARDTAFSKDGNYLVTGGWDGILQLWELASQHLVLATPPSDVVRIIYFLPKDKNIPPNITQKIDKSIRKVQDFYAGEMERHGFGRKTFKFETDENGKAKIYLVKEGQTADFDLPNDIWIAFVDDIPDLIEAGPKLGKAVGHNQIFWYPTFDGHSTKGNIWMDEIIGVTPGKLVYATIKDLKQESVAYILRGAFSIPHDNPVYEPNVLIRLFFHINDKMPWGKKWAKLSKCEAEWLDKSRFFNPNQPFFDKRPKIEMKVSQVDTSESRLFQFDVSDEDGIHQVQLFVPADTKNQWQINKFHDCQALNGKMKANVIFEITDRTVKFVTLRMIDIHGNIAAREFHIKEKADEE